MEPLHSDITSAPALAPAEPVVPGDAAMPTSTTQWYWCEYCYIVSERPGQCPSCWQELTAVTGGAVPYGPYLPRTRRVKQRVLATVVSALLVLAVPTGAALALFRAGSPIRTTPSAAASDSGLLSGPYTPVDIPVLGNFWLPGQGWAPDENYTTALTQGFAKNNGGEVKVALSDGPDQFGVVKIPPSHKTDNSSSNDTVFHGELLEIEGYQVQRNDVATPDAGTGVITYEHVYVVLLPDKGQLVIDVVSRSTHPPFAAIEKRLLTYPNSKGPDPDTPDGPWSNSQGASS